MFLFIVKFSFVQYMVCELLNVYPVDSFLSFHFEYSGDVLNF